jgi:hypothetical protein
VLGGRQPADPRRPAFRLLLEMDVLTKEETIAVRLFEI